MTSLPPRVDWHGNESQATAREIAWAKTTAARIRGEIAEIRAAAERLATGDPFEIQVAEFLSVQATMLERNGSTAQRADGLSPEEDTTDRPGMFPTAPRSALLIARSHLASNGGSVSTPLYPTHRFAGSSKTRQEVGLPGHCERCAELGHVKAHPKLGCGDVGCTSAHDPADEAAAE